MKVLKNISVSLLSFLLFVSILAFGLLFIINSTVMNPDFVSDRVDEIDFGTLMNEVVEFESSPESDRLTEQIKILIPKVEPVIKERINIVIHSYYDYLLGKKQEPEIKETLGKSFFNQEFVSSILAEISLPDFIEAALQTGEGENELPEEFIDAFTDVVADMEPEIKEEASEISGPVFDYILGVTSSLNLKQVLRDTVLNEDFVVPLINNLDLSALAGEVIAGQILEQIPDDTAFLADYVEPAVDALEPVIKAELEKAAGPFLDYLLGETNEISIYISLETVVDTLERDLRAEWLSSPPAEFSGLSRAELENLYDEFFSGIMSGILPSTIEIDESVFGPELATGFSSAISEAEESITEIKNELDGALVEIEEPVRLSRQYVSWFRLAYILLLVVIGVTVLGISLILRDVRSITRTIGVPLLVYGALEYVSIWVARYFIDGRIHIPDIPPGIEGMLFDFSSSFTRPAEIFGLSLLVIGLVLTVVSFVYRRGQKEPEAPAAV